MSFRAVQTTYSDLVHLIEGFSVRTRCGVVPVKHAPQTIKRFNMCSNCFGKDRGVECWPATKLNLAEIK